MNPYKAPGIYLEKTSYVSTPKIDTRCLTGFVGVSERGELNKPVHIRNFDEYVSHFGAFGTQGMLPKSVMSFFQNGGEECIVVRVANEDEIKYSELEIAAGDASVLLRAQTPGAWANKIKVSLWADKDDNFSLSLTLGKKSENFIHLSYDINSERYFEKYINSHSSLVKAEVHGKVRKINPFLFRNFSGGDDGIENLRAEDIIGTYTPGLQGKGLGCFEKYDDISLTAVPDIRLVKDPLMVMVVWGFMAGQAERFKNRIAIFDMPADLSVDEVSELAANIPDSDHAAVYYPDIVTQAGVVPPSGAVCGMMAKMDKKYGQYRTPAGILLNGVSDVSKRLSLGEQEILYSGRVNYMRYFQGQGVRIWGNKTLASDTEWRDLSVRRTFNSICAFLRRESGWAAFELNNTDLRKRLVRFTTAFLIDLWKRGYLAGKSPEEAFFVVCNDELNPPEDIRKGLIKVQVGVAIVHPVEFMKITFAAKRDSAEIYIDEE